MVGSLVLLSCQIKTKLSSFNDNTSQLLEKPSKAQGSQLESTYKAHTRWDRGDKRILVKSIDSGGRLLGSDLSRAIHSLPNDRQIY